MEGNWMARLAAHYATMRTAHPGERLLILFDVDGTIFDSRFLVYHLLKTYDREHGTGWSRGLAADSIDVHESQVAHLVERMGMPRADADRLLAWYETHQWASEFLVEAPRPYPGVLEVIRWFQLQPDTYVGINTGRPESWRADTMRSLSRIASDYRVTFDPELVYLNRGESVRAGKAAALEHFRRLGYRVFAFVDNEPENLASVGAADPGGEILLLHADTLFESSRRHLPPESVTGTSYDLTQLIGDRGLPPHIAYAWRGAGEDVGRFLASWVEWGECEARFDPTTHRIIERRRSFGEAPLGADEQLESLEAILARIRGAGKKVKIDLSAGGALVGEVLDLAAALGFADEDLWFSGNVEDLGEEGFGALSRARPGAVRQCAADFLGPLIASAPGKAREILQMYASWGINRFSLRWRMPQLRKAHARLEEWGFAIDLRAVPDLAAFLSALLLLPRSITADFDFPQWRDRDVRPQRKAGPRG
jgi:hypothetical protein